MLTFPFPNGWVHNAHNVRTQDLNICFSENINLHFCDKLCHVNFTKWPIREYIIFHDIKGQYSHSFLVSMLMQMFYLRMLCLLCSLLVHMAIICWFVTLWVPGNFLIHHTYFKDLIIINWLDILMLDNCVYHDF